MPETSLRSFRALCSQHGIAVTHQRQVLYETMQSMYGHPSPEEVFAAVKTRIPSISLATVYKNIHLFVESGVFRELSIHHGTLRVEMNSVPHHHTVCSVCRKVVDLPDEELTMQPPQTVLANGFMVERVVCGRYWRVPGLPAPSELNDTYLAAIAASNA